jgi:hypothetical protein
MPRGKPFPKGVSGNPGGRPKETPEMKQMKEVARKRSIEAIEIAVEIMNDEKAKATDRLKAVDIILDRAWGRPTTAVEPEESERNGAEMIYEAIQGLKLEGEITA